MKATKILPTETEELKISSLPTRPTAPTAYGGRGYTAKEMKEAFDKLPLLIAERFNLLLDDFNSPKEESPLATLATGLYEGHTLCDLINDLKNGNFAAYLTLSDKTLAAFAEELDYRIDCLFEDFSKAGLTEIFRLDCGSASERIAYLEGKEEENV